MLTRRRLLIGAASAAALAAMGCDPSRPSPADGQPEPPPGSVPDGLFFPPSSGTWETAEPQNAGWDPDKLAAAFDVARETGSSSFLVLHAGRIVAEAYWAGGAATAAREVASVQKSVTSALIANAAAPGHLAVDDPVSQYLGSGWSKAPASVEGAITIRHLLGMSSGLDDQLRPVAPPGRRWHYNTPAYHLLHPVLETATNAALPEWCDRTLFGPIGVTGSHWEWHQDATTGESGYGLAMTARDMGRLGLLILADGVWQGSQVLPPGYENDAMRASQADNRSYGLLWWLNSARRKQIPPAPADLVSAQGARGQRIYIVPSLAAVVVRQSADSADAGVIEDVRGRLDETLWTALMDARAPS